MTAHESNLFHNHLAQYIPVERNVFSFKESAREGLWAPIKDWLTRKSLSLRKQSMDPQVMGQVLNNTINPRKCVYFNPKED